VHSHFSKVVCDGLFFGRSVKEEIIGKRLMVELMYYERIENSTSLIMTKSLCLRGIFLSIAIRWFMRYGHA
jgi:hypothetical protein